MAKDTYPKRFAILGHLRVSRYELDDMRAYARLATGLMSMESDKHAAHVDSVVEGMSEGEREAYFFNNHDTHELMLRRFPNQQQQSLVVLTYTVVETRLIAIARSLLRDAQPGLELKDLAGDSPFKKARMVITKIAGLDIEQKLWDAVEPYRLVRNSIVHTAGELPSPPPQPVQQLLKKYPDDIQYSEGSGLVVRPALIVTFAAVCEELLEAVFARWLALEESREGLSSRRV
ncbi:hypothetical protein SNE35_09630 [Paucibacter sp. R3-3]|uniref:Cthe-2314-like HEPN domain-containing protein n=1 Tax=Roseateles agri TaxID=3098619 RepID=A0ABU5DEQ0_9BURK|nr:hypothetical protein [Paucibacter sp. R3-3]MDY0744769.1 hypothetical protein [Paucibacter sp. R3-3]